MLVNKACEKEKTMNHVFLGAPSSKVTEWIKKNTILKSTMVFWSDGASSIIDKQGILSKQDLEVDGHLISDAVKVAIGSDVTTLASFEDPMFYECPLLSSASIPDSVKSIGFNFYECNEALYDKTSIPGIVLVDNWVVDCDMAEPASADLS